MASVGHVKLCMRLVQRTSRISEKRLTCVTTPLLTRFQPKLNCRLNRHFSLSASALNESTVVSDVEDDTLAALDEEKLPVEEKTDLSVNFDFCKREKRFCYEDGVPDVLYRR